MNWTTLTSVGQVIWRTLEAYRIDPAPLFREAGLDPGLLRDANARYPLSRMQALWRIATQRSGDPCFGLRTVDFWQPTSLHALGYAWMASSTLMDGFHRLQRYIHLVATSSALHLRQEEQGLAVSLGSKEPSKRYVDATVDAGQALLVAMCRLLRGEDFAPLRVDLRHEEPACRGRYFEYFRAPVVFGAEEDRLWLDPADLHTPLPGANADLARVNEQIIHDYLARFDDTSLAMLVRAKLVERLPAGEAGEDAIATALAMSRRSLQRRLKDEGTSFKQVLDAMRQDLATGYVDNSSYSINEIAYLLGFSEPGNFSRAFKRWHGLPPSEYRRAGRRDHASGGWTGVEC